MSGRGNDIQAILALIVALKNAAPSLITAARERDEAQRELAECRSARDEAIKLMSEYARQAGDAKGRLGMSEAAGIVEGWRERAEKAEAQRDEALRRVEEVERENRELRAVPEPFGEERGEPWAFKPTARALADSIADLSINDRSGLIQRVRFLILRDRATAYRRADEAIRERDEAQSALEDLQGEVGRFKEALRRCKAQFEFYVEQHMAKSPPDGAKAEANEHFAAICRMALNPNPEAKS